MLGYCGINCGDCPAYKGSVQGDLELLEKAAAAFGYGACTAKEWVCLGCRPADQPILSKYCNECRIRACAAEKQVFICAACEDYEGCRNLHGFISEHSTELVQKMSLLRERFLQNKG